MKKYIRVCISLDQKTTEKINALAKAMNTSKSEAVKTAIIHCYYGMPNIKDQ